MLHSNTKYGHLLFTAVNLYEIYTAFYTLYLTQKNITSCASTSWPSLHAKVTYSLTYITHTKGLLSCLLSLGKLRRCECLLFIKISLKNGLDALRTNLWACNCFLSSQVTWSHPLSLSIIFFSYWLNYSESVNFKGLGLFLKRSFHQPASWLLELKLKI